MIEYSIILLCYNEGKNLNHLIKESKKLIKNFPVEIIFVDNGSTDNTNIILRDKLKKNNKIKSISVKKNIGYGYGVICGLNKANGKLIGWTHGDDLDFKKKLIEIFTSNNQIKKIFIKGFRVGKRPLTEIIFSYGFNVISTICLRRFFWEITATPTIFSKNLFLKYKKLLPYDFSIDLYLYFFAKKNNYKIKRFNFLYKKRKFGVSSWNKNLFSKFKLSINYILKIIKLIYFDIAKN